MPADQRLASIIAATRPLLAEHGLGFTTRQVAEATGIAEGTIFRHFGSKDELISTVIADSLDVDSLSADLRAIDLELPLTDRVAEAVSGVAAPAAGVVAAPAAVPVAAPAAGVVPVPGDPAFGEGFDIVRRVRAEEADEFYAAVIPATVSDDDRHIARRAFAGLLWGKQLYRYYVDEWLAGDPAGEAPPLSRVTGLDGRPGRNVGWRHLALADVISMPDEWEYPWFAAWDLAFHTVPLAHIDPEFAKHQLVLMCREWAQHPNGQLPAYEWAFEDVNPPVHAWACWQVYAIDGGQDQSFLIQVFNKLLLNFSWWVNRKDADGTYLFEGGFLGMDNITLFDRSTDVPPGYKLEQSDATSWMAFFSQSMLRMALELARRERGYDNAATTFLQYFINLARAMDRTSPDVVSSLWNEEDGFFYDALQREDGEIIQLRVRSMVGLLPLRDGEQAAQQHRPQQGVPVLAARHQRGDEVGGPYARGRHQQPRPDAAGAAAGDGDLGLGHALDQRPHRTSLTAAMTNANIFPSMVLQMTAIGEESGALDHMLGKAADFYEAEVDEMVAGLSSLMEPIIIVVLGTVIGGIVVSMYLPIFKLGQVV